MFDGVPGWNNDFQYEAAYTDECHCDQQGKVDEDFDGQIILHGFMLLFARMAVSAALMGVVMRGAAYTGVYNFTFEIVSRYIENIAGASSHYFDLMSRENI